MILFCTLKGIHMWNRYMKNMKIHPEEVPEAEYFADYTGGKKDISPGL
jgi:hypothetical protein